MYMVPVLSMHPPPLHPAPSDCELEAEGFPRSVPNQPGLRDLLLDPPGGRHLRGEVRHTPSLSPSVTSHHVVLEWMAATLQWLIVAI